MTEWWRVTRCNGHGRCVYGAARAGPPRAGVFICIHCRSMRRTPFDNMFDVACRQPSPLTLVGVQAADIAGKSLQFLCKASFLEIYNEKVFDLLDPSASGLRTSPSHHHHHLSPFVPASLHIVDGVEPVTRHRGARGHQARRLCRRPGGGNRGRLRRGCGCYAPWRTQSPCRQHRHEPRELP